MQKRRTISHRSHEDFDSLGAAAWYCRTVLQPSIAGSRNRSNSGSGSGLLGGFPLPDAVIQIEFKFRRLFGDGGVWLAGEVK
jgi:hypothetical protein